MDATKVLEAIDAERSKTWQRAEREFKEVLTRRDSDLAKLNAACQALTGADARRDRSASPDVAAEANPRPKSKRRVRRRDLSHPSPDGIAERRDKVARFVEEMESVSLKEVARGLGLTIHKAYAAITDLKKEGRIKAVGVGSATRYEVAARQLSPLSRQAPIQGTIDERIVTVLEDRHHASAEELGQALNEPVGRIREACGELQGENKVAMTRINNRPVYVLPGAALMAASLKIAFAEVAGPKLDRIAYAAKPIHRASPNPTFRRAFSSFDRERLQRSYARVARRRGCCLADAQEAVDEELAVLMEKKPELFETELEQWWGLLVSRASFRVLAGPGSALPGSTDAIAELGGDAALAGAEPCVAISPQAEEDAGDAPLPGPGEGWSRPLVISGLQRFHRYYGRPPLARECRPQDRLPSYTTIRKLFGSLEKALLAAGIVPTDLGRRHRRWTPVEAARACRSFYRRYGYWPGAGDARRHPDLLPGRSVMRWCFGSTHGGEIRAVAEAILAGAPCERRRRRD